jgi:hypothetical protein
VPRVTCLRALFPDARLSLPVAGKSCIAAGEGDGSGDLDSAIGIRYDHGVEDLGEKEAVLAANPDAFFTIPHFDGYSAVLIQLPKVSARALRDAITDGWLACAPPALARRLER